MGRYSLNEILNKIDNCLSYISKQTTDVYTITFWVCSLLMLHAALKSGLCVVNANNTISMFNYSIPEYRNAYAHNESLSALRSGLLNFANNITDDMYVYPELETALNLIKDTVAGMEES